VQRDHFRTRRRVRVRAHDLVECRSPHFCHKASCA
jgi:hypothetical protein